MTPETIQKFAALYDCNESEIQADGILNPDLYAAASPKVLWILKETWVHDSWKLLGAVDAYQTVGGSPTYLPMAYAMHSIFNGHIPFLEMEKNGDQEEIFSSLRHIAFMNVKKILGGTRSDDADVHRHYSLGKDLLVDQINEINPDVIIGCLPHFPDMFDALGIESKVQHSEYVDWAIAPDGRVIIYAYHPSQTTTNRGDYVNDIVQIIKQTRAEGEAVTLTTDH